MKNKRSLLSSKIRIIALILAVVMILASIDLHAIFGDILAFPTIAVAETLPEDAVIRNDALHFFIRHWNTADDDDAELQGKQEENGNHFVIVEGYIVPVVNPTDEDTANGYKYHFYLVNQGTGELIKLSEYLDQYSTNYIGEVDRQTGELTLKVKLLANGSEALENFAGFSVSAGHGAVSYADGNEGIVIKYDKDISLVKGHIFYTTKKEVVRGTTTDGEDNEYSILFGTEENPEIDAMTVYTWAENNAYGHTAGAIVNDNQGNYIKAGDELPDGIGAGDVELTTFYSTKEGLHTNKTLMQSVNDDRMFLFDLETWYTENYASQVGLMLDASGGMTFALDKPSVMTVWSALATTLNNNVTPDQIEAIYNDYLGEGSADLTNLANALTNAVGYEVTKEDVIDLFNMVGKVNNSDLGDSFLSDKLLGLLLNPRNTDNSAIGVNGYNYFVTSNDVDYEPLAYWEGTTSDPADKTYTFQESTDDVVINWPNGHSDLSFGGTAGLYLRDSQTGIVLDAKPTSGSFTISFTLRTSNNKSYTDPATANRKIKEILYIGSMSGDTLTKSPDFEQGGGYYRLFRDEGNSSNRLRANSISGRGNLVTDIDGVFTAINKKMTFTLVFDGDTVTSYMDGTVGDSGSTGFENSSAPFKFANANDINIIINGIADSYDGMEISIDNVYVYDNALDGDAVKTLATEVNSIADNAGRTANGIASSAEKLGNLIGVYTFTNSGNPINDDKTGNNGANGSRWWMKNDAEKAKNMYPLHPTLGAFASKLEKRLHITDINGGALVQTIKWTDYDTANNQQKDMYLAYTSDGTLIGEVNTNTMSQAGWYHMNHRGSRGRFEASGTAKRLNYMESTSSHTMTDGAISYPDPISGKLVTMEGTGKTYTTSSNLNTQFYIDSSGYLRCFFGGNGTCSFVYYLADEQYTKAEGLQRILANFTTQLLDRSLGSEVSAVQFSYNGREDRSVMLDWTGDSAEISGIMSQTRGEDTSDYGTGNAKTVSSRGVDQYNYALTGSTYFSAGLQAFQEQLMDYKADDKGAKFFVIFTDGESASKGYNDKNSDEYKALQAIRDMKDAGYTVISIFFGDQSKSENEHAIEFLKMLAGAPSDTGNTVAAGEAYFYDANDMDTLMARFEKDILELMAKQLEGYTVKDYIDPRFNLVDQGSVAERRIGTVWQLLANGKVKLSGTEGDYTYDLLNEGPVEFPVAGTSKPDIGNPMLCYDASKDMYYLEWTDQIIPPSSIGATKLQIWKAQIVLCAKDDFIGGNAILTNGNDAYMNWVYNPADSSDANEREAYMKSLLDKIENGKDWDTLEAEAKAEFAELDNSELTEEEYVENYIAKYLGLKTSKHDASSGTTDRLMEYSEALDESENPIYDDDGNITYNKTKPLDAYVSKGFPRTTVNVGLTKIDVGSKYKVVYMGEVVSPSMLLTEIEGETITDSYYLEYIKRYAYQRYLFSGSTDELNMPLWDILNGWLQFGNEEDPEKSFSIPYMYLPSVQFDAETGKIITDKNGNATILNSTGFNTKEQEGKAKAFDDVQGLLADVVGILTYRWEILEPATEVAQNVNNEAATKDYVKSDTERIRYALTVGFTPLREGDTLDLLNKHDDDGDPIFANYLPIRGVGADNKWTWDDAEIGDKLSDGKFIFDRETRVNGIYIKEKDDNGDTVFAWSPEYKPAIYERQLKNDITLYTDTDDTVNLINEGKETTTQDENGNQVTVREFAGDPRTIKGYSVYSLNVVSGDIILEFKLQTGELENLLKTQDKEIYDNNETCDLDQTFKLNATRSFTENKEVQDLKDTKHLSDYGDNFTLTFKFDSEEIKAQLHKMYTADPEKYADYENDYLEAYESYLAKLKGDATNEADGTDVTDGETDSKVDVTPLEEDELGFVKIYAEAKQVDYTWKTYNATTKDFDEQNSADEESGLEPLYEHLPIGTYEFSLADANENNQKLLTLLRFGEIFSVGNDDEGKAEFKTAYEKFNDVVLNGLHTSNEKIVDKDGNIIDHKPTPAQRRYDKGDKAGQLVYYTNPDTNPFTADEAANYTEGTDSNGNTIWYDKDGAVAYWYDTNLSVWRDANGERVPYYWSESEIREITPDDVGADDNDEEMEVKSRSITHYIADSKSDDGKEVSFYLGTDKDNYKNPNDNDSYYPEHRVGIVALTSGTTKLTIVEDGGNENESFLYLIEGKTLSGKDVSLTVSVKGGSHTTIAIVAGTYKVTEVSSWSWRYKTGTVTEAVEWKHDSVKDPVWNGEDGKGYGYEEGTASSLTEWAWNKSNEVLEKTDYASEVSGWTEVTQADNQVSAEITLYTDTYDAVITFKHVSNDKTWVGGENYDVTTFPESSSERSQGTGL